MIEVIQIKFLFALKLDRCIFEHHLTVRISSIPEHPDLTAGTKIKDRIILPKNIAVFSHCQIHGSVTIKIACRNNHASPNAESTRKLISRKASDPHICIGCRNNSRATRCKISRAVKNKQTRLGLTFGRTGNGEIIISIIIEIS